MENNKNTGNVIISGNDNKTDNIEINNTFNYLLPSKASSTIVDQNTVFKAKFSDREKGRLFLEDRPILLKHTYVNPQVEGYDSLDKLFEIWLSETNEEAVEYTEADTKVLLLCGKA